jgi:hypothetical protein
MKNPPVFVGRRRITRDRARAAARRVAEGSGKGFAGGLRSGRGSEPLETLAAASAMEAAALGVCGYQPNWCPALDKHNEYESPFTLP